MKHVDMLSKQFNACLNLPGSKSITLRDAVLGESRQWRIVAPIPRRMR